MWKVMYSETDEIANHFCDTHPYYWWDNYASARCRGVHLYWTFSRTELCREKLSPEKYRRIISVLLFYPFLD